MNILGIETSCDETAAAVVRDGTEILSNVVSSQIELHRPYGGVVPEIASRNHLQWIEAVIAEALHASGCRLSDIDAVAATYGPGLASSLLIGLSIGKALALATAKPFYAINHIEAHLYSPFFANRALDALPAVALIVSGGHTILAHATAVGQHRLLGQTLDDAAGEAFDKVAKLLGLGYPGGPQIDRLARGGNPHAIEFPRSMLEQPGHDFSFSGLKTSVLYFLRKHQGRISNREFLADVCASFQEAVVDVLVGKTVRAALQCGVNTVSASGGVSINSRFREKLRARCRQHGLRLLLAPPELCTDNAAMIAAVAFYKQPSDFSVDVAPSAGLAAAA